MNERGECRSIRRVLLDGPDFQRLPERARWAFVALKLNAGPTGIDVLYPDALAPQLARQTGMPVRAVRLALDALEAGGWIRREANLVWIVGHLKHDPHMSSKDRKHRMAVQRAIASMPRLELVRGFVAEHPDWFPATESAENSVAWALPDGGATTKKALPRPTEGPYQGPSKHKTETERETETETRTKRTTSRARQKTPPRAGGLPPRDSWLGPASRVWQARFGAGSVNFGKFGRILKQLHEAHSPATIAEHLQRYLERTDAQYASLPRFAETFAEYGPTDPNALVDEWGVLTPYGEKVTRPPGLKIA